MTEPVEEVVEEIVIEDDPKADPEEKPEAKSAAESVEDIAKELGWNPDHEGEDPVDAATFIRRSKDISRSQSRKIKNMGKELDALREGVGTLQGHLETKHASEIKRLNREITDLKAQRREAVEDGDADKVDQLDGRIGDLEESAKAPAPKTPPPPPPEYVEWIAENSWFDEDPDMRHWANAYAQTTELQALLGNPATYKRFLKAVSDMAEKVFPDKFEKKKPATTPSAPAVASPTPKKPRATKATAKDLTYEQRKVGEEFISQGIYKNLDEYAQKLNTKYGER